jgi:hypothetical protein
VIPALEIDPFVVVDESLTAGTSTDVEAKGTPTRVLEDAVPSTNEIGRLAV